MAKVTVDESIEIGTGAARAWKLLGDFAGNHRWMPAVTGSAMSGSGIGATRRLTMEGGGYVDERLVERDEAGMRYQYTMFGGSVPVQDYESEISVAGDGRTCRVRWTAQFEPVPDAPLDALALVREVYRSSLASAKALLERD
jgi:hypothetical protein